MESRIPKPHLSSATAPYASRPPSPPYINVPIVPLSGHYSMSIVPSFADIDPGQLAEEDLSIITQGRTQRANDRTIAWRYEMRRDAQSVLDFLYLGPVSAAKDQAYLLREGITMILVVRDSMLAGSFLSVVKNAHALGIEAEMLDIAGKLDVIPAFPRAINKINNHLLGIYRNQAIQTADAQALGNDKIIIDNTNFKRGKVLLCCETGNNRSAMIAAAYLMSVFGLDMVKAAQFLSLQRFCVTFDDDNKHILRAYEDIIGARRIVNQEKYARLGQTLAFGDTGRAQIKRPIEATEEGESGTGPNAMDFEMDEERYTGRGFAPFVEQEQSMRF
ncbi:protein-tyrosine phosphatase-like protein [Lasiosphaeria miniovina]|uniref:Protein-tyrosine phosphatase-like protein n=1 Tax=Lasiosphaeria miniovina TaxID=1954250 RepID=A0AA39ZR11_9PEZI|nr:protein-tyrosine phosphatase-like protein [Lasiosphaeria miniovina]KAK0701835.1 protein-tyrosine phosphatase-like protein [Lasiosphaeria miniovina]